MSTCCVCDHECWYGVNALYLNPLEWNDKRLICDQCNEVERDPQGRIVKQGEPAKVLSEFREVRG